MDATRKKSWRLDGRNSDRQRDWLGVSSGGVYLISSGAADASKGRAGAEELVLRVSSCFDGLIEVVERHGGDVLKFRGDALLLFFRGDRHADAAVVALNTDSHSVGG